MANYTVLYLFDEKKNEPRYTWTHNLTWLPLGFLSARNLVFGNVYSTVGTAPALGELDREDTKNIFRATLHTNISKFQT